MNLYWETGVKPLDVVCQALLQDKAGVTWPGGLT